MPASVWDTPTNFKDFFTTVSCFKYEVCSPFSGRALIKAGACGSLKTVFARCNIRCVCCARHSSKFWQHSVKTSFLSKIQTLFEVVPFLFWVWMYYQGEINLPPPLQPSTHACVSVAYPRWSVVWWISAGFGIAYTCTCASLRWRFARL